eukprot:Rmarinus@m.26931
MTRRLGANSRKTFSNVINQLWSDFVHYNEESPSASLDLKVHFYSRCSVAIQNVFMRYHDELSEVLRSRMWCMVFFLLSDPEPRVRAIALELSISLVSTHGFFKNLTPIAHQQIFCGRLEAVMLSDEDEATRGLAAIVLANIAADSTCAEVVIEQVVVLLLSQLAHVLFDREEGPWKPEEELLTLRLVEAVGLCLTNSECDFAADQWDVLTFMLSRKICNELCPPLLAQAVLELLTQKFQRFINSATHKAAIGSTFKKFVKRWLASENDALQQVAAEFISMWLPVPADTQLNALRRGLKKFEILLKVKSEFRCPPASLFVPKGKADWDRVVAHYEKIIRRRKDGDGVLFHGFGDCLRLKAKAKTEEKKKKRARRKRITQQRVVSPRGGAKRPHLRKKASANQGGTARKKVEEGMEHDEDAGDLHDVSEDVGSGSGSSGSSSSNDSSSSSTDTMSLSTSSGSDRDSADGLGDLLSLTSSSDSDSSGSFSTQRSSTGSVSKSRVVSESEASSTDSDELGPSRDILKKVRKRKSSALAVGGVGRSKRKSMGSPRQSKVGSLKKRLAEEQKILKKGIEEENAKLAETNKKLHEISISHVSKVYLYPSGDNDDTYINVGNERMRHTSYVRTILPESVLNAEAVNKKGKKLKKKKTKKKSKTKRPAEDDVPKGHWKTRVRVLRPIPNIVGVPKGATTVPPPLSRGRKQVPAGPKRQRRKRAVRKKSVLRVVSDEVRPPSSESDTERVRRRAPSLAGSLSSATYTDDDEYDFPLPFRGLPPGYSTVPPEELSGPQRPRRAPEGFVSRPTTAHGREIPGVETPPPSDTPLEHNDPDRPDGLPEGFSHLPLPLPLAEMEMGSAPAVEATYADFTMHAPVILEVEQLENPISIEETPLATEVQKTRYMARVVAVEETSDSEEIPVPTSLDIGSEFHLVVQSDTNPEKRLAVKLTVEDIKNQNEEFEEEVQETDIVPSGTVGGATFFSLPVNIPPEPAGYTEKGEPYYAASGQSLSEAMDGSHDRRRVGTGAHGEAIFLEDPDVHLPMPTGYTSRGVPYYSARAVLDDIESQEQLSTHTLFSNIAGPGISKVNDPEFDAVAGENTIGHGDLALNFSLPEGRTSRVIMTANPVNIFKTNESSVEVSGRGTLRVGVDVIGKRKSTYRKQGGRLQALKSVSEDSTLMGTNNDMQQQGFVLGKPPKWANVSEDGRAVNGYVRGILRIMSDEGDVVAWKPLLEFLGPALDISAEEVDIGWLGPSDRKVFVVQLRNQFKGNLEVLVSVLSKEEAVAEYEDPDYRFEHEDSDYNFEHDDSSDSGGDDVSHSGDYKVGMERGDGPLSGGRSGRNSVVDDVVRERDTGSPGGSARDDTPRSVDGADSARVSRRSSLESSLSDGNNTRANSRQALGGSEDEVENGSARASNVDEMGKDGPRRVQSHRRSSLSSAGETTDSDGSVYGSKSGTKEKRLSDTSTRAKSDTSSRAKPAGRSKQTRRDGPRDASHVRSVFSVESNVLQFKAGETLGLSIIAGPVAWGRFEAILRLRCSEGGDQDILISLNCGSKILCYPAVFAPLEKKGEGDEFDSESDDLGPSRQVEGLARDDVSDAFQISEHVIANTMIPRAPRVDDFRTRSNMFGVSDAPTLGEYTVDGDVDMNALLRASRSFLDELGSAVETLDYGLCLPELEYPDENEDDKRLAPKPQKSPYFRSPLAHVPSPSRRRQSSDSIFSSASALQPEATFRLGLIVQNLSNDSLPVSVIPPLDGFVTPSVSSALLDPFKDHRIVLRLNLDRINSQAMRVGDEESQAAFPGDIDDVAASEGSRRPRSSAHTNTALETGRQFSTHVSIACESFTQKFDVTGYIGGCPIRLPLAGSVFFCPTAISQHVSFKVPMYNECRYKLKVGVSVDDIRVQPLSPLEKMKGFVSNQREMYVEIEDTSVRAFPEGLLGTDATRPTTAAQVAVIASSRQSTRSRASNKFLRMGTLSPIGSTTASFVFSPTKTALYEGTAVVHFCADLDTEETSWYEVEAPFRLYGFSLPLLEKDSYFSVFDGLGDWMSNMVPALDMVTLNSKQLPSIISSLPKSMDLEPRPKKLELRVPMAQDEEAADLKRMRKRFMKHSRKAESKQHDISVEDGSVVSSRARAPRDGDQVIGDTVLILNNAEETADVIFFCSPQYSVQPQYPTSLPIVPDEQGTLEVRYTRGEYDDPDVVSQGFACGVDLTQNAYVSVEVQTCGVNSVAVFPSMLSFPPTTVGATSTVSITVRNTSTEAVCCVFAGLKGQRPPVFPLSPANLLDVDLFSLLDSLPETEPEHGGGGRFNSNASAHDLPSGAVLTFRIVFSPEEFGLVRYTAHVLVLDPVAGTVMQTVPVTLVASSVRRAIVGFPTRVNFGMCTRGVRRFLEIKVENKGTAIETIQVLPPEAGSPFLIRVPPKGRDVTAMLTDDEETVHDTFEIILEPETSSNIWMTYNPWRDLRGAMHLNQRLEHSGVIRVVAGGAVSAMRCEGVALDKEISSVLGEKSLVFPLCDAGATTYKVLRVRNTGSCPLSLYCIAARSIDDLKGKIDRTSAIRAIREWVSLWYVGSVTTVEDATCDEILELLAGLRSSGREKKKKRKKKTPSLSSDGTYADVSPWNMLQNRLRFCVDEVLASRRHVLSMQNSEENSVDDPLPAEDGATSDDEADLEASVLGSQLEPMTVVGCERDVKKIPRTLLSNAVEIPFFFEEEDMATCPISDDVCMLEPGTEHVFIARVAAPLLRRHADTSSSEGDLSHPGVEPASPHHDSALPPQSSSVVHDDVSDATRGYALRRATWTPRHIEGVLKLHYRYIQPTDVTKDVNYFDPVISKQLARRMGPELPPGLPAHAAYEVAHVPCQLSASLLRSMFVTPLRADFEVIPIVISPPSTDDSFSSALVGGSMARKRPYRNRLKSRLFQGSRVFDSRSRMPFAGPGGSRIVTIMATNPALETQTVTVSCDSPLSNNKSVFRVNIGGEGITAGRQLAASQRDGLPSNQDTRVPPGRTLEVTLSVDEDLARQLLVNKPKRSGGVRYVMEHIGKLLITHAFGVVTVPIRAVIARCELEVFFDGKKFLTSEDQRGAAIDFGVAQLGTTVMKPVVIRNRSVVPMQVETELLPVDASTVSQPQRKRLSHVMGRRSVVGNFSTVACYRLEQSGYESLPGSDTVCDLHFTAEDRNLTTVQLYLRFRPAGSSKFTSVFLPVTGKAGIAKISFSTTTVDFGDMLMSSRARYTINMLNSGDAVCRWKAHTPASLRVRPSEGEAQPGSTIELRVRFSPQSLGEVRDFIAIHTDVGEHSIGCRGQVLPPYMTVTPAAAEFDFGHVTLGTTALQTVKLKNTSSAPVTYRVGLRSFKSSLVEVQSFLRDSDLMQSGLQSLRRQLSSNLDDEEGDLGKTEEDYSDDDDDGETMWCDDEEAARKESEVRDSYGNVIFSISSSYGVLGVGEEQNITLLCTPRTYEALYSATLCCLSSKEDQFFSSVRGRGGKVVLKLYTAESTMAKPARKRTSRTGLSYFQEPVATLNLGLCVAGTTRRCGDLLDSGSTRVPYVILQNAGNMPTLGLQVERVAEGESDSGGDEEVSDDVFSVETEHSILKKDEKTSIQCEFSPKVPGFWSHTYIIKAIGNDGSVAATARLTVVGEAGVPLLDISSSVLDFGTCFFGQKQSVSVVVMNRGSHPTSFAIVLRKRVYNFEQDDSFSDDDDASTSTATNVQKQSGASPDAQDPKKSSGEHDEDVAADRRNSPVSTESEDYAASHLEEDAFVCEGWYGELEPGGAHTSTFTFCTQAAGDFTEIWSLVYRNGTEAEMLNRTCTEKDNIAANITLRAAGGEASLNLDIQYKFGGLPADELGLATSYLDECLANVKSQTRIVQRHLGKIRRKSSQYEAGAALQSVKEPAQPSDNTTDVTPQVLVVSSVAGETSRLNGFGARLSSWYEPKMFVGLLDLGCSAVGATCLWRCCLLRNRGQVPITYRIAGCCVQTRILTEEDEDHYGGLQQILLPARYARIGVCTLYRPPNQETPMPPDRAVPLEPEKFSHFRADDESLSMARLLPPQGVDILYIGVDPSQRGLLEGYVILESITGISFPRERHSKKDAASTRAVSASPSTSVMSGGSGSKTQESPDDDDEDSQRIHRHVIGIHAVVSEFDWRWVIPPSREETPKNSVTKESDIADMEGIVESPESPNDGRSGRDSGGEASYRGENSSRGEGSTGRAASESSNDGNETDVPVTPTTLNLGNILAYAKSRYDLDLLNHGDPVSVTLAGGFKMRLEPASLQNVFEMNSPSASDAALIEIEGVMHVHFIAKPTIPGQLKGVLTCTPACFLHGAFIIPLHIEGIVDKSELNLDTAELNFGVTRVLTHVTATRTLSNPTSRDISFTVIVEWAGEEADDDGDVRDFWSVSPTQGVLSPGASVDLVVRFSASSMVLGPDDLHRACVRVMNVTNTLCPPSTLIVTSKVGQGKIVTDQEFVSFAVQEIGFEAQRTIRFSNVGQLPVVCVPERLPKDTAFSVTCPEGKFEVEAGEVHELIVTFTPMSEGVQEVSLNVLLEGADAEYTLLRLAGVGAELKIKEDLPAKLDFGEVEISMTKELTFTITNDCEFECPVRMAIIDERHSDSRSEGFSLDTGFLNSVGSAFSIATRKSVVLPPAPRDVLQGDVSQDALPTIQWATEVSITCRVHMPLETSAQGIQDYLPPRLYFLREVVQRPVASATLQLCIASGKTRTISLHGSFYTQGLQTGLSDPRLDFGLVFIGRPKTLLVRLHNPCPYAVPFEVETSDPNQIEMKPAIGVAPTGTLPVDIQVTLNPDTNFDSATQRPTITIHSFEKNLLLPVVIPIEALTQIVTLDDEILTKRDFGTALVGTTSSAEIPLQSLSDVTITCVLSISLQAPFKLTARGVPGAEINFTPTQQQLVVSVLPGARAVVPIVFEPTDESQAVSTVEIAAGLEGLFTVELEGVGVIPTASLLPAHIDFGLTPIGTAVRKEISLMNTCMLPLAAMCHVDSMDESSVFQCEDSSLFIHASERGTFTIVFRPTDTSVQHATLRFVEHQNNLRLASARAVGRGGHIRLSVPPPIDLGSHPIDSRARGSVSVANTGEIDLTLHALTMEGLPITDAEPLQDTEKQGNTLVMYPQEFSLAAQDATSLVIMIRVTTPGVHTFKFAIGCQQFREKSWTVEVTLQGDRVELSDGMMAVLEEEKSQWTSVELSRKNVQPDDYLNMVLLCDHEIPDISIGRDVEFKEPDVRLPGLRSILVPPPAFASETIGGAKRWYHERAPLRTSVRARAEDPERKWAVLERMMTGSHSQHLSQQPQFHSKFMARKRSDNYASY